MKSESLKIKKITVSKIKNFLYPQKTSPTDHFQKFSMIYLMQDSDGNNYQYVGATISEGFMPFGSEILSILEVGDEIEISYMTIKSQSSSLTEKDTINKVIKVKKA